MAVPGHDPELCVAEPLCVRETLEDLQAPDDRTRSQNEEMVRSIDRLVELVAKHGGTGVFLGWAHQGILHVVPFGDTDAGPASNLMGAVLDEDDVSGLDEEDLLGAV